MACVLMAKSGLMVVNDFNVLSMPFDKSKADAVLLIDTDRVLSLSITREGFEPCYLLGYDTFMSIFKF